MSNIQVSHSVSTNNARSESNVAVNPVNPNQLVGASKKFIDPFAYRFTLAAYYSSDAGHTWAESTPGLTLLAGWDGISDPAVAWDNQGNCFIVALPFAPGVAVLGIAVYKSTDGGATWGVPKVIHAGAGDDKQWALGDSTSGAVYAAWDDGSTLRFARTLDHGATWVGTTASPAAGAVIAPISFAPEMAINASGHLYIFFSQGQGGSTIDFVKSIDGGNTFTLPQAVVTGMTSIESVLPTTSGWAHLPGGIFRVLTIVTCSVGRNNEIMVAWADGREQDGLGNHPTRIYYRRSIDGGTTWLGSASGDPLLSNNATVTKSFYHFHPQIINRPNSDQMACTFYEFGPKTGGQNRIDTMIAYSSNNGGSFPAPSAVTDSPWDPLVDAPWSHGNSNVQFIGDYFGFDASNVGYYPFWTDTRTGIQEIFTDIMNPIHKVPKAIVDKYIKESIKEHFPEKIYLKEIEKIKDLIPEKSHIKEKDKEKDIYEGLGQKLLAEAVNPLDPGIVEQVRNLEDRVKELEKGERGGGVFIRRSQRPDVGSAVVKTSNRRARAKKPRR